MVKQKKKNVKYNHYLANIKTSLKGGGGPGKKKPRNII